MTFEDWLKERIEELYAIVAQQAVEKAA